MNHLHSAEGPESCFGCKVKSVGSSFGSVRGVLQGPAGRKAFHGPTIGQRRAAAIAETKARGVTQPAELTRRERRDWDS